MIVQVKYDSFRMALDLDYMCKKHYECYQNGKLRYKYPYTKTKLKKIFKYMCLSLNDDELDEIGDFLRRKGVYGDLFDGVRSGEIRVKVV